MITNMGKGKSTTKEHEAEQEREQRRQPNNNSLPKHTARARADLLATNAAQQSFQQDHHPITKLRNKGKPLNLQTMTRTGMTTSEN